MTNKFPNKLTSLRKSLGYAQGELASRLDVSVKDYMNWENGNSLPAFSQIQKICVLFNIPVELLMDNKKEISEDLLNTLSKSVMIPSFIQKPIETEEVTKTMDMVVTESSPESGHTKVMPSIKEVSRKEEIKKEVEKRKKFSRKTMMIVSALVVLLVFVLIGVTYLLGSRKSLTITDQNRLAVGNQYSIYIHDNGKVNVRGSLNNPNAFENLVQVSAYEDLAVGLKKDGTVVSNQASMDTSKLKSIKMIASGKDHILALKDNGTVSCLGNENACHTSDWKNVEKVFAGNGVSVGITKEQTILISGNASELKNARMIKSIVFNDDLAVVLKTDGTVMPYSLTGLAVPTTSSLTKIKSIALSKEGIFAIDGNNKIKTALVDEKNTSFDLATLARWQNVRFVAGSNQTLVAMDSSEKMIGMGDNQYNQYENTSTLEEPKVEKLAQVKNISFTETTANVNITWDRVENASSYHIMVDTNPGIDQKDILSNSYSIPASQLENGKTYKVTITALSDQSDKYAESEVTTINYTYNQKVIELASPSGLTNQITKEGWMFSWNPVEHADYYSIIFDGRLLVEKQIEPKYHLDNTGMKNNSTHTFELIAHSNTPDIYKDSPSYKSSLTYYLREYSVTFSFIKDGEKLGEKTYTLAQGSYTLGAIIHEKDLPKGTKLANPTAEVDISGITEQNVEVK